MRTGLAIALALAWLALGQSVATAASFSHNPHHGCPSGYVQKSAGECVCPKPDAVVDGKCVGPSHCPPGWDNSAGQCKPNTSCPSGEALIHGHCVGAAGCPPGGFLVRAVKPRCEAKPSCPAGYTLQGALCVAPVRSADDRGHPPVRAQGAPGRPS